MAELYRHADRWGDTFKLVNVSDGLALVVYPASGSRAAVHMPDDAGRRLLDALLNHYGPAAAALGLTEGTDHRD